MKIETGGKKLPLSTAYLGKVQQTCYYPVSTCSIKLHLICLMLVMRYHESLKPLCDHSHLFPFSLNFFLSRELPHLPKKDYERLKRATPWDTVREQENLCLYLFMLHEKRFNVQEQGQQNPFTKPEVETYHNYRLRIWHLEQIEHSVIGEK